MTVPQLDMCVGNAGEEGYVRKEANFQLLHNHRHRKMLQLAARWLELMMKPVSMVLSE